MKNGGVIVGRVDNGRGVQLVVGQWSGSADLRERDGKWEVTYIGTAPSRFPQPVTIDGQPSTAIAAGKTPHKSFAVLIIDRPPSAE